MRKLLFLLIATLYSHLLNFYQKFSLFSGAPAACADIVNAAIADASDDQVEEGESQLLPLLQGLLNHKYQLNKSHDGSDRMTDDNFLQANGIKKLDSLPFVEDSGTESGEDLRLLAAGLQNSFYGMDQEDESKASKGTEALGTGLLAEVTAALARLQTSLLAGKDINLDDSKKEALLSLVARLQSGLISPEKIIEPANDSTANCNNNSPLDFSDFQARRGSSGASRFAKRKNRVNRHTVGVSREELADARRIIEELELINNASSAPLSIHSQSQPEKLFPVMKNSSAIFSRQISEPVTLMRPSQFIPKDNFQKVDMPASAKYRIMLKQSISLEQPPSILKNVSKSEPFLRKSEPLSLKPEEKNLKKYASSNLQRTMSNSSSSKFAPNPNENCEDSSDVDSSDDEEEPNKKYFNQKSKAFMVRDANSTNGNSGNSNLNYSSGDETNYGKTSNKYMSKKMKMKRANTVNLPKSYSSVNCFNFNDKENSDTESRTNGREPQRVGLRTTIIGGTNVQNDKVAPKFTPKTENDHKFIAFINKQNSYVTPGWVNPADEKKAPKTQNWNNKFGNLKGVFEADMSKIDEPKFTSKLKTNSAASFWKNIEVKKEVPKALPPPKPVKLPVEKTPEVFEKIPLSTDKFPWTEKITPPHLSKLPELVKQPKKKILLDSFIPTENAPPAIQKTVHAPGKILSKPLMVSNFSHAPMSAFKPPISKKSGNIQSTFKPIQNTVEVKNTPMPVSNGNVKQKTDAVIGSVKSAFSVVQPRKSFSTPSRSIADLTMTKFEQGSKPGIDNATAAPWSGKSKSERVLNIAASKFEQHQPVVNLSANLEIVKMRSNPVYNGTLDKRSSLPPNAVYASFDPYNPQFTDLPVKKPTIPPFDLTKFQKTSFDAPTPPPTFDLSKNRKLSFDSTKPQTPKSFEKMSFKQTSFDSFEPAKEPYTFVITDFTQPTSISTYANNEEEFALPNVFHRSDSLTNPDQEPIVLTNMRHVISPREPKDKARELYELSLSLSPIPPPLILSSHSTPLTPLSNNSSISEDLHTGPIFASDLDLMECKAAVSKVMAAPVCQTAVSQNSGISSLKEQAKEETMMRGLHDSLKKFAQKSPTPEKRKLDLQSLSQDSSSSSLDLKLPHLKIPIFDSPKPLDSARFTPPQIQIRSPTTPLPAHVVFNNTVNRTNIPAAIPPQQQLNLLQRAQSSHSLAIPKHYGATVAQTMHGATQEKISEKQKTVAAYFSGSKSPKPLAISSLAKPSSPPNQHVKPVAFNAGGSAYSKASERMASRTTRMATLSRSKTLPHIRMPSCELLDESNIDDAFEELLSATNL